MVGIWLVVQAYFDRDSSDGHYIRSPSNETYRKSNSHPLQIYKTENNADRDGGGETRFRNSKDSGNIYVLKFYFANANKNLFSLR